MVDKRCAMMMEVLSFIRTSKASCTNLSDSESKEEVASSKIKIAGFFNNALAMAIRCLCPPDNFTPLSPTTVS
jgi:hypothetical protein